MDGYSAVRLRLSPPFTDWADGQKEIVLPVSRGATLRDIIEALAARYPDFVRLSLEGDERLRERAIFVWDGHIVSLSQRVEEGAELQVLVPIAGGRL